MKKVVFIFFAILACFFPTMIYAEENLGGYAPSLSVVDQGYNWVSLSALSVDGSTSFLYQRSEDKINWIDLITTTETSYKDNSGLITGRTYYYRVLTIDPDTNLYSNASAVIEITYKLDKPTFEVIPISAKSYRIDINPVEGASKYKIYQCAATNYSNDKCKLYETNDTSYTFDNIISYYEYRVSAVIETVDGDVEGALTKTSSYIYAKTPAPNVSVKSLKNGTITLTWDEIPAATKFVIFRRSYSSYTPVEIATLSSGTNYTDMNLDINERYCYYIFAYSLNASNDEESTKSEETSYIYPINNIETPTLNASLKDNDVTLTFNEVDYAKEYYIYELINGEYELKMYSYNGTATIEDIDFGTHTYAVKAIFNDDIYSGYSEKTINYIPKSPLVMANVYGYNQNGIFIINQEKINKRANIYVYRSSDKVNYTLVKKFKDQYLDYGSELSYVDYISNAVIGKTYYYKAVIKMDGTNSSYSNVLGIKSVLKKPTMKVRNYAYNKQIISVTSVGKGVKYQVYQSTSKNGKYKKVCDQTGLNCLVSVKYGKGFYYKVRAYAKSNNKYIYTGFTSIKGATLKEINELDKFPVTLQSYTTSLRWSSIQKKWVTQKTYDTSVKLVVKSVTVKQKKNNTYTFKINYKSKYSNGKTKLSYKLRFYNYNASKTYTYNLTETKLKKGTQKNKSTTYTLTVPSWAMYYYFV